MGKRRPTNLTRFLPGFIRNMHVGIVYTVVSALIIIGGTYAVIEYAKGSYRLTNQGILRESGLLNTNSFPTGAEVYIDGRLVTATDDTLYLEPGQYEIEIVKDGYWPWKKSMSIEQELVTQTNALLFPTTPSLTPLTFSGVEKVWPSPDGQKLLYLTTTSANDTRNGLFVFELTDSFLSLQRGTRHLAEIPNSLDLNDAEVIWSPDSNEIMILTEQREVLTTIDSKQNLDVLPDISFNRRQILSEWEEEMYLRERQILSDFPPEIVEIATQSAQNIYISPDRKRMFYTAIEELTIPDGLVPPIPARNTQPETRQIQTGSVYVYDREEDKNFFISEERYGLEYPKHLLAIDLHNRAPQSLIASPSAFLSLQEDATQSAQLARNFNRYHTALHLNTFQWFPDSRHLLYTTETGIEIRSYDNTNRNTVYSGPFDQDFVYPWPDGRKVLILTAFNPELPMNLYAIELR